MIDSSASSVRPGARSESTAVERACVNGANGDCSTIAACFQ
ncbi:MAG: hypothetical protein R3F43_30460 [bacterium]